MVHLDDPSSGSKSSVHWTISLAEFQIQSRALVEEKIIPPL